MHVEVLCCACCACCAQLHHWPAGSGTSVLLLVGTSEATSLCFGLAWSATFVRGHTACQHSWRHYGWGWSRSSPVQGCSHQTALTPSCTALVLLAGNPSMGAECASPVYATVSRPARSAAAALCAAAGRAESPAHLGIAGSTSSDSRTPACESSPVKVPAQGADTAVVPSLHLQQQQHSRLPNHPRSASSRG